MLFQHRDGELRLYSGSTPATPVIHGPYYAEILFVNAGFSAPIRRPYVSENIVMDRGVYTADAEYRKGMDEEMLEPLDMSFTFKCIDDVTTQWFVRMITGVSGTTTLKVHDHPLRSTKGESKISGISTPIFADSTKMAWDVGVLWDGTTDLGFRWREVTFPEVTVSEGEEEVTITANGKVYGDVTRITAFWSGTTIGTSTAKSKWSFAT